MSFWGKLGKGLLMAAGGAAAPFTGGASLVPTLIGAGGAVAAGAAAGRAQGRAAEAGINQNQDQVGLQAARFNMGAPQQRAQNAVRGDLLAGLQDVNFERPAGVPSGRMTGGVRPSLLSSDTRALGKQMSRDALLSQMQGDAFTPTALPQSGKLDTLLNILGGVGTGVTALNALRPPTAPVQTAGPMVLDPAPWRQVRF